MVLSATSLTPESMISMPRRSPAKPNSEGTFAVYATTSYSFHEQKTASEIRVLDLQTGQSRALSSEPNSADPAWVFEDQILWLRKGQSGSTQLIVGWPHDPEAEPQIVATFDGPVSDLKLAPIDEDTRALAVVGQVTPEGCLYNPEKAEKPRSTARIYDSLFARHWNSYTDDNSSTIFYATVKRSPRGNRSVHTLSTTPLANALSGHSSTLATPVAPFFSSSDWDLCHNGIVFVSKNPQLNPSVYMSSNVYYIPFHSFSDTQAASPIEIKTGVFRGTSSGPKFSPDGKSIAFTRQRALQYENDKARLFVVPDLTDPSDVQEFFESADGEGAWDASVQDVIEWSEDGKNLFFVVEEAGRKRLYAIPSNPRNVPRNLVALTRTGCVSNVARLPHGKLLITSSSFVDNSCYSILRPQNPDHIQVISSNTKGGKKYGLSPTQFSEAWFQGAAGYPVHMWIIKPSKFDETKKYPVALVAHGGPQAGLCDWWSFRWNFALLAEQGYIVVAPNFTGSSGFGFAHQNAIQNNWGGAPYRDMELAFQHVELHCPYADTSRAVGLGASYGGFMMNWIQGHPLGRKLKALVSHDGMMTQVGCLATDELYFYAHEYGGLPWIAPEGWHKWSPFDYAKNWDTPMLVIHSDLDYRCPVSDGNMAFNILQAKGVPSRYLNFPDEGHFVSRPENSLVWHKEVFAWIDKYTDNTYTKIEDKAPQGIHAPS